MQPVQVKRDAAGTIPPTPPALASYPPQLRRHAKSCMRFRSCSAAQTRVGAETGEGALERTAATGEGSPIDSLRREVRPHRLLWREAAWRFAAGAMREQSRCRTCTRGLRARGRAY